MSSASSTLRAMIVASLAASFIFAGPCDASSTTPCNAGKAELSTVQNTCCCETNCECGTSCGSGESQAPAPSETTSNKDSLRDLAKIANVFEMSFSPYWAILQSELKSHSAVSERISCAPTLLSQHTCLQV